MPNNTITRPAVIWTSRGLTIADTRITLYTIMDYLRLDWPAKLIRDRLNLTDKQIKGALDYIEEHRNEVESEYNEVLKYAEESREYWEDRNRERFAEIAAIPPKPGQEELRTKLKAWKEKLNMV